MFPKPAKGSTTRTRRTRKVSRYRKFLDAAWAFHAGRLGCRTRCARCGVWVWRGLGAEVDHIQPKSTHPELRYDVQNTRITCATCNRFYKTHPLERGA